jgi:serine/threonine protein kinase
MISENWYKRTRRGPLGGLLSFPGLRRPPETLPNTSNLAPRPSERSASGSGELVGTTGPRSKPTPVVSPEIGVTSAHRRTDRAILARLSTRRRVLESRIPTMAHRHEPGTRLGVFEVLDPLGAGGMGDVYRARDTRLGREVALKTLPASRAAPPSRLARLRKEARILGALTTRTSPRCLASRSTTGSRCSSWSWWRDRHSPIGSACSRRVCAKRHPDRPTSTETWGRWPATSSL